MVKTLGGSVLLIYQPEQNNRNTDNKNTDKKNQLASLKYGFNFDLKSTSYACTNQFIVKAHES
jgi:hypothetical protein